MLIDHHFTWWWMLVPIGMVVGLAHREERLRQWTLLLVCIGSTYLYVDWFPQFNSNGYRRRCSRCCGARSYPVHVLLQWTFSEQWSASFVARRVLPWLLLFFVFLQPYTAIIGRTYFPKEYPWDEDVFAASYYLHNALRGGPLEVDALCHDSYNAHLMFYVKLLNEQGKDIKSVSKFELKPGMRAMAVKSRSSRSPSNTTTTQVVLREPQLAHLQITGIHEATP